MAAGSRNVGATSDNESVSVAADRGGFGSSLFAGRAFGPGDTVLEEDAAFVIHDGAGLSVGAELLGAVSEASGLSKDEAMAVRIAAVLDLWLSASAERRAGIRSMFGKPDDGGPMAQFVFEMVRGVQTRFSPAAAFSTEELSHSVLVWLLSGYRTKDGSAMFTLGHRANHSCFPNITYHNVSGEAGRNTLIFRALRSIELGEPLYVSYLVGEELMAPRSVRQRLLAERKSFDCRCSRCTAEHAGCEPGRALHCNCGGRTQRISSGQWRCTVCSRFAKFPPPISALHPDFVCVRVAALCPYLCTDQTCPAISKAGPTAALLEQEQTLVNMALERTLRLENLNGGGWGEHWVTAVASWLEGIENLRGGIESGDKVRAHSAFPHVVNYFAWAERHWPGQDGRHIVSTQAAECYACLSAMNEPEAMVLASRICSPYMAALEHEFGADDKQNVVMRRFLSGHCGNCGKQSKSCCSRCKLVSYCGSACQKTAWKEHKKLCATLVY